MSLTSPFSSTRLLSFMALLILMPAATSCKEQVIEPIDFTSFATPESKALALSEQFPGMSVTVIRGDHLIWDWSHGYADVESQTPVTSDTRFNIYSVSKMITGMAFARLQSEGDLLGQTRVRTISPDLPTHYDDITVSHLLSHRSGIRHYKRGNDWKNFSKHRCATTQDGVAYFSDDPLEFEPGTDQLYSTFGMVLASHILVEATDADNFAEALNKQLNLDEPVLLDGDDVTKATAYKRKKKAFQRIEGVNAECKFAGGGLVASSKQLAQIGVNFVNGEIMPLDQLRTVVFDEEQDSNRFGFAMAIGNSERLDTTYASMRGGATGGRGMLMVLPDTQISIALVANAEGEGRDVSAFVSALAEHFMSESLE